MESFDLLIPIHLPAEAEFNGSSGRGGARLNEEVAFAFGDYPASLHKLGDRRYIVVRLGLAEPDVKKLWPHLRAQIAIAAAILDVSIRPIGGEMAVLASGERADLDRISLFPAGETPYAMVGHESYSIGLPASVLSKALSERPDIEGREVAFQVFADVDFEATTASRFVLLSTILELLAVRQLRDENALALLDRWANQAKEASRPDLEQALASIRNESIGSAIARLVRDAAVLAGCSESDVQSFQKRARNAYRKRSALLHSGVYVSKEELASLRSIVRLVLVGKSTGTPFTVIGTVVG